MPIRTFTWLAGEKLEKVKEIVACLTRHRGAFLASTGKFGLVKYNRGAEIFLGRSFPDDDLNPELQPDWRLLDTDFKR
eukprot:2736146-Rhodomonas_salina.2